MSCLRQAFPYHGKKGALHTAEETHRWIGIEHSLTSDGAIMRLPPEYLKDLAILIEPLSHNRGVIALSDPTSS